VRRFRGSALYAIRDGLHRHRLAGRRGLG